MREVNHVDGPWVEYYDNDKCHIKTQGHYKNGEREGKWRGWYDAPNHTLKYEGYYADGRRDGVLRWYDEDGNVTFKANYIHGARQD